MDFSQTLYEDLRQNDMTKPEKQPAENYSEGSHIRVLIFELADGTCTGFNYQYLISTTCSADNHTLELDFTTHMVQLTGVRLHLLYYRLAEHLPRIIRCRHERFGKLVSDEPIVYAIKIVKK